MSDYTKGYRRVLKTAGLEKVANPLRGAGHLIEDAISTGAQMGAMPPAMAALMTENMHPALSNAAFIGAAIPSAPLRLPRALLELASPGRSMPGGGPYSKGLYGGNRSLAAGDAALGTGVLGGSYGLQQLVSGEDPGDEEQSAEQV